MNNEPELQLTPTDGDLSLSVSTARSSLIARGRRDATNLSGAERMDLLSETRRRAENGNTGVQLYSEKPTSTVARIFNAASGQIG